MANAIEDVDVVKETINDAIKTISEKFDFGPREEYKALRGLAFQAFGQAIEEGTFKQLVKDAQLNAKHLPRGWGMVSQAAREEAEAEEEPVKTPKKKATKVEETDEAPAKKRRPRRVKAA